MATDIIIKTFEKTVNDTKANGGDIVPRPQEPNNEKIDARAKPSIVSNNVCLSIKQEEVRMRVDKRAKTRDDEHAYKLQA